MKLREMLINMLLVAAITFVFVLCLGIAALIMKDIDISYANNAHNVSLVRAEANE